MRKKLWNLDYNLKISKLNLIKLTDSLQEKLAKISILIKHLMNKMHGKVDNRKSKNSKEESNNFNNDLQTME